MRRDSLAGRLLAELKFPLTDTVVLIAMLTFGVLVLIVREAGMLGIWLGVIMAPALWRYLLMLLEARAQGRSMPVAGIEIFNVIDNFWSLSPLVIVAVAIWGSVFLQRQSALAGQAFALLLMAMVPASAAVLALTRSPRESLDPRALVRLVVACGPAYALAPASLVLGWLLIGVLEAIGAPAFLIVATGCYALFLVFTLTGSLLNAGNLQSSISIPETLMPDEEQLGERRRHDRRGVLTHAYGFFTRDNRAGGLAHVRDALRREGDDDEAWRWYLDEMFRWESKDAALLLGQVYLGHLLHAGRDVDAVKLVSRCLLADPRFRPAAEHSEAVRDLLERLHRPELTRALDLGAGPTGGS